MPSRPLPRRGEIWLVQFTPGSGRELIDPHPALVLSRDDVGILPLRVVVPLTTFQERFATVPWMITLEPDAANGLRRKSVVDCFQPRSFDTVRFLEKWGELSQTQVEEVARTVAAVIGILPDKAIG